MGLFDGFIDSLVNDNLIGWVGETFTEFELGFVKLFGRDGKILRNVYIPKDNGETSEIDVLYITQKGIFVLESKNYSGWIFGDEKAQNWTAMLPNKQKHSFYNPIKQNKTHIKWLENYMKPMEIPLFSIIVFSNRCTLKKITAETPVINRDDLYKTIRSIWDKAPDVLSAEQITAIYDNLNNLTNADRVVKQSHIDDIRTKYNNNEKQENIQPENNNGTVMKCKLCGSNMVIRTARKGANAGKQFYGCSAYPKCRYIEQI